ncbi:MAG: hypothetical protein ACREHF_02140 [Rhizomicrobium sp.]
MAKFVFRKDEPARVVAWPCRITVPQSGGASEEQEISAKFRLLAPERAAEIVRGAIVQSGDVTLLKECLVGFSDLKDEAGDAVSDEISVPLMLSLPYAVAGLVRGYFDMLAGRLPKN